MNDANLSQGESERSERSQIEDVTNYSSNVAQGYDKHVASNTGDACKSTSVEAHASIPPGPVSIQVAQPPIAKNMRTPHPSYASDQHPLWVTSPRWMAYPNTSKLQTRDASSVTSTHGVDSNVRRARNSFQPAPAPKTDPSDKTQPHIQGR